MKKLFIIVAALFVAVSFSSCNKDDEGGERNKPVKLVAEIKLQGKTLDGNPESYSFYYDQQNRITMIVWGRGGMETTTTNISYSSNTISIEEGEKNTVATVSNGLITSAIYTDKYSTDKYTYIYNGNYLTKTRSTGQEKDKNWSDWDSVEWNNGNLISETDSGDYSIYYEYTNITNKTNIDFAGLLYPYYFDETNTSIRHLFSCGFLGNISRHLLQTIRRGPDKKLENSIFYDLDKEGCPTIIRKMHNDDDRIDEYHITYK